MEKKPIKRHKALQPLSRQHHFGLLFSWKLRKGFAKNIEISRLANYSKWFYENEIKPHFEAEERHLFTILDANNELIIRALKEHREIEKLFNDTANPTQSLSILEDLLQEHIRFEERVLFNEIQLTATQAQLDKVEEIHQELPNYSDYADPFWE